MITTLIKDGPNKQNMFRSFARYAIGQGKITFLTEGGSKYEGTIFAIEYDDKVGISFNFKFVSDGEILKGWYNTKFRKGWIQAKKKDPQLFSEYKAL